MIDRRAITFLAACFLTAAPALAQEKPKGLPSASVTIQQIQVAFIGSGAMGGGTLKYGGKSYPITVGGLGVGGFGASRLTALGTVYGLTASAGFGHDYAAVFERGAAVITCFPSISGGQTSSCSPVPERPVPLAGLRPGIIRQNLRFALQSKDDSLIAPIYSLF